ncbi:MAG: sigma-54-dependent transcriptional regulator [Myxococcota bacterium]
MAQVLVVDDELSIREFLEIMLSRLGHQVHLASSVEGGLKVLSERQVDLVLSDMRLPAGSGLDVLRHAIARQPQANIIMMTAFATMENAIEAMKLGAYDYIMKPFQVDELTAVIGRALERQQLRTENRKLRDTLDRRVAGRRLIGASDAMKEVQALIEKVAPTKTTVLLTGESGTGKELVARAIHARSPRAGEPFVAVNCGAIPETLIESELFGHTKGAFTGATSEKQGYFEVAGQGTLFLDEIGELPLSMQVRLLRVLQERRVRRLGGVHDVEVHCRVIAATNRRLEDEVQQGRFREDLFFRLNVIQVRLPSLRERRADIPLLADAFVARFAEEQGSTITGISDEAMRRLVGWKWPGNIRELENVIERGVTLADGPILDVKALPREFQDSALPTTAGFDPTWLKALPEGGLSLETLLDGIERQLLLRALERTDGRKKKAAELLQLSFRSFRYRCAKFGIVGAEDEESDPV